MSLVTAKNVNKMKLFSDLAMLIGGIGLVLLGKSLLMTKAIESSKYGHLNYGEFGTLAGLVFIVCGVSVVGIVIYYRFKRR